LLQILGTVLHYAENAPEKSAGTSVPPGASEELPAVSRTVANQREQTAEEIRLELRERKVADTEVRVAGEGVAIVLNNIQFKPDSAELTEDERIKLMKIGVILVRYPGRRILVGGHAAMAGDAAGRARVSAERAQAVADFLVYLDVRTTEEIVVRGFGAEQPLGNAEDRALNRRVEIILLDR
jgi:outer membrane protein OmpA-like peptidoglycan-associated protein